MNNLTITGNLGRDAEVRYTPSGKAITNFSIAHTPRVKRNGEWVDGETLWLKVEIWDELPSVLFTKGVAVLVTGSLTQDSYEKDGVTKTSLVLTATDVALVQRAPRVAETKIYATTAPTNLDVADESPF